MVLHLSRKQTSLTGHGSSNLSASAIATLELIDLLNKSYEDRDYYRMIEMEYRKTPEGDYLIYPPRSIQDQVKDETDDLISRWG